MPSSSHTHKSMLLRGVRLPTPALNGSDVEELKGKMRNAGRSYRGAPLGRQHNGGRRGHMNFGPDSRRGGNNHHQNGGRYGGPNAFPGQAPVIPPGWAPPPPGFPGFGSGVPPPPPAYHGGNGGGGGGGYGNYGGQMYNQQRGPPGVPPYQQHGAQFNGPPPHSYQGRDRRHDGGRGQRGGRGYGHR